ncbi:MAG: SCP2 sterol-binding domain-containing protein [Rhodobacter sp.]|nr:SCP2 sterol-binding domain-containing protein [Rhodobacter sp.]MCY4169528.1 SCP2 sterol-binding domain-containing protein [Rhodobacter sp.]MCY4242066.1 SCP2 sterol-binding domain-containing protein [Rhodobacter sp.]
MSDIIESAVRTLSERIRSRDFDSVAKFAIKDEGSIIVDGAGARAGAGDAEVTLAADAETFRAILRGDLSPTAAFMKGALTVDGDMSVAIRLGSAIS